MSIWTQLLSVDETVVLPWFGGRRIGDGSRTFNVKGRLPDEYGWQTFAVNGSRNATWSAPASMANYALLEGRPTQCGYLVGDRLLPEGIAAVVDPAKIVEHTLKVELIERGLDRFSRVRVAHLDGHCVFAQQEFPLGPEMEVSDAFLERKADLDGIKEVIPALEATFRWESWRRSQEEFRAAAAEARRREEERRRQLETQIGTGQGRRALAKADFKAAAAAALAVSGATLLDARPGRKDGERVVQFRYDKRRFECVVEASSLRIIDAGICLVNHGTGEKGDTYFTLESLPAVIAQAIRESRLHVWRHV